MIDYVYLLVTTIIPKAGIQLGGVPLTLNIILTAVVVFRSPTKTFSCIQFTSWSGPIYFLFIVFAVQSTLLSLGSLPAYQLAQNLVVMISPLVIVVGMSAKSEYAFRIITLALIAVTGYALCQFFFGIVDANVPGVTSTLGQNITEKNIGYGMSGSAEANKMPSTYQSGNYFGIFCALGSSLLMLWNPNKMNWKKLRLLAIAAGYIGISLCGSRSIVIPYILLSVLILITRFGFWRATEFRRNLILTIIGVFLVVFFITYSNNEVLSAFIDRIVNQTLQDSTASGRISQWANIFQGISEMDFSELVRLALFGQGAPHDLGGEGLPEFLVRFGAVPTMAFYGLIFGCVLKFALNRRTRPLSIGLFSVFIALCVDQAFYYPPVIMEFFLVVGIGIAAEGSAAKMEKQNAYYSSVQ